MNDVKKVYSVRLILAFLATTLFGSSYLILMSCRDCCCVDKKLAWQMSQLPVDLDAIWGKENIIPVVVVGSGAAGLSSAMYGARARLKTLVITGHKPGGAFFRLFADQVIRQGAFSNPGSSGQCLNSR